MNEINYIDETRAACPYCSRNFNMSKSKIRNMWNIRSYVDHVKECEQNPQQGGLEKEL
tara:strand:+ start:533 stop:706 length:174 start_codon:yes stop_codon:yes gene_type:complete